MNHPFSTLKFDRIQDSLYNKSFVWLDQIELTTQLNQFEVFEEHSKLSVLEGGNDVLDETSVERKPCINIESKSLEIKFSYTDVMMKMNLLEVVIPQSIYHGCFTRKTFWEEKFTGEGKLFSAMNMKNCGCHNISNHREIKGSDKYVTLDIALKFDSLDKIKSTSSESKDSLVRSGKGLITSLGLEVPS